MANEEILGAVILLPPFAQSPPRMATASQAAIKRLPTLFFPSLSCSSQLFGAGLSGHPLKASMASGCGYYQIVMIVMKLILFLEVI